MARASDRFLAALRTSHKVLSYVDVISPTGQTLRLTTIDGDINVDRTVLYRRAGTITCIDPTGTLTPDGADGILTPLGTEVRPYRGIDYQDGTVEVYALGVFRIAETTVKESVGTAAGAYGIGAGSGAPNPGSVPTGAIQILLDVFDRSRKVARDKFTDVYVIATGTNIITAIKAIVRRSFPDVQFDSISTTITTPSPLVYSIGDDPWVAATALAVSLGCDLFFDVDGDVVIAPPPDINSMAGAAMTYIDGGGNTLTALDAVYTDTPGFNGVVVVGQSPGTTAAPVMAAAWDTEPTSPTYWQGPYGRVPMTVNDNTITTVADAQAAASSLLKGLLGFSAQLTATSWVNPALDTGDVVGFQRDVLNVSGLYSIDVLNIPLMAAKTQALTVRQKRTVS